MPAGKTYLYEGIYARIKSHITNGNFQPGEKLKSVRFLSQELGVSPTTVFNAYYKLEAEGLVKAKPKQGYFIRDNLPPLKAKLHKACCKVTKKSLIQEVIEASRQPGMIDFSTGVPGADLLPSDKLHKSIRKAYQKYPAVGTMYPHSYGLPALRRQICNLALSWGRAFHESQVLVTAGCMEAMALSLRAVVEPGDTVAISTPAYFGTLRLMEVLGLKVIPMPVCPNQCVTPGQVERVLQAGQAKAIVLIPNFNNPNGALMPAADKQAIARLAATHRVPVIEDDIYGEVFYEGQRPVNIKTFDQDGWVVYCNSFSKTLAPGFRVGWVIPGRFYDAVYEQKIVHNLSTADLSQAALAHFLEKGRYDIHLRRLRKQMQARARQYSLAFQQYFGRAATAELPPGGYVAWLKLNNGKDSMKLYQEAQREGIGIVPGTIFSPLPEYSNYFRLSIGHDLTPERRQALRRLGQLIHCGEGA